MRDSVWIELGHWVQLEAKSQKLRAGNWLINERSRRYSRSRCTVSMENAGKHTAMYSAPSSCGVE